MTEWMARRLLPTALFVGLVAILGMGCPEYFAPQKSCAPDDDRPECSTEPMNDAGPAPEPDACHQITFGYRDGSAQSVWVSGTFNSWAPSPDQGAIVLEKDGDLWSTTTTIEEAGRHLYKFIVDGNQWVSDPANPVGEDDGLGGRNSVLEVCPEGGGETEPPEPVGSCTGEETWQDAVFYFALVDRFHDSDGQSNPVIGATDGDPAFGSSGQYAGGDLAGVTAKISYLQDLGITALWLSAPYENRNTAGGAIDVNTDGHAYSAYHGYWPSPADIDFSDPQNPSPRPLVESRIGSEADLHDLVGGLHDQGMKIVFDYVMNHVDIESGLYAAHGDWFALRNGEIPLCAPENLWDDPEWGKKCAFTSYLPAFDFDVPAARAWSVADALWWAQNFGIDGYRLDAIKHVPRIWLSELRAALNENIADPALGRFYLVGETYDWENRDALKAPLDPATGLDGQFDFPMRARLCDAFFKSEGRLDAFSTWMDDNDAFYPADSLMMNWVGNHDIPRAIHYASDEIAACREGSHGGNSWTGGFVQPSDAAPYQRLALAFAFMLTQRGIPLIYYGDEIGLAGGGDPDNRRFMPWDDATLNDHQKNLRATIQSLAQLRRSQRSLSRGVRWTRFVDQTAWVYTLTGCSDSADVTVMMNSSDGPRMLTLPEGDWNDAFSGAAQAEASVELEARSFRVFVAAD
jgi:glycosidase